MTDWSAVDNAVFVRQLRSRARRFAFYGAIPAALAVIMLLGSAVSQGTVSISAAPAYLIGYIVGRMVLIGIPATVAVLLFRKRRSLLAQARRLEDADEPRPTAPTARG
ncbi:hypothetical protein nbrc107696_16340 [Gordonia spumicola]|uniref:Uncharacterized protein n=1 Tax=Gordonia spumicola TaxID=589161 RepID=A0A7I9V735_9ACTN|nr:hypothetical protein [Gordonia spumicola]GEE01188.1 hypothetical protein nbrc107696_16340 [Gordonia spumicola]